MWGVCWRNLTFAHRLIYKLGKEFKFSKLWWASTKAQLEIFSLPIIVQYFLSLLRTFRTEFNLDDGDLNYSNRVNFMIGTKSGPLGCQTDEIHFDKSYLNFKTKSAQWNEHITKDLQPGYFISACLEEYRVHKVFSSFSRHIVIWIRLALTCDRICRILRKKGTFTLVIFACQALVRHVQVVVATAVMMLV